MRDAEKGNGFFGVFEKETGVRRWTYFPSQEAYDEHIAILHPSEKPLAKDLTMEEAMDMASKTKTSSLIKDAYLKSHQQGKVNEDQLELSLETIKKLRGDDLKRFDDNN